jgi:EmrB/QacA subfamily drug resistance transporter
MISRATRPAQPETGTPAAVVPGRAAGAAIVAVCSASLFMIAIDTTVVNLALPLIGRGLHTPVSGLQWTIAAYTITTASLMLTAGSIGDRFGRRAVFQAGLAVYTLASLGCSLAPGAGWLIAFRALQGAGGAALTPMSLGIITATFTDPAARARAIGIWTATFGAGMAAGPVIGGALASALGWRSVFWITILPGLAAIVLARLVLPQSRAARPRRLDPPGQVLVIVFLACLTYGIIEGPSHGWRSAPILSTFAAAAVAVVGLVVWERQRAEPLIELRVFRSVPFSGALVITLCAFAGLGGFLFLTALYLQDAKGMNVWQAGLWLLPIAVGAAAAPPLTGRVLARRGARWPLVVGGAALAAGCLVLAQAPPSTAGLLVIAVAYVIFGAGYGAVNTVVFAAAVAGMPSAQAGVAGGISSAGRQAGQSLGVSATGAIFAVGLHGTLHHGFASASHPAWMLNAACGLVVVLLGLVTTSRRAIRTAARVAIPVSESAAGPDAAPDSPTVPGTPGEPPAEPSAKPSAEAAGQPASLPGDEAPAPSEGEAAAASDDEAPAASGDEEPGASEDQASVSPKDEAPAASGDEEPEASEDQATRVRAEVAADAEAPEPRAELDLDGLADTQELERIVAEDDTGDGGQDVDHRGPVKGDRPLAEAGSARGRAPRTRSRRPGRPARR